MKNLSPSDCSSLEKLKATLSDFLQKIPKNPCTGTVDMAFKILCFFFWLQKSQQLCEIETTVWGSKIYNFYNIGKSRQIRFHIL